MLNQTELRSLAKAYVALSCAHQLELILAMLDPAASYRSANVGNFEGRSAIAGMMADFFQRFPDVYWQVAQYRGVDSNTIEFEFEMTASEASSGVRIMRQGLERLEFTQAGYIKCIIVS